MSDLPKTSLQKKLPRHIPKINALNIGNSSEKCQWLSAIIAGRQDIDLESPQNFASNRKVI